MRHILGPTNVADALSRLLDKSQEAAEQNKTEEYLMRAVEKSTPVAMNIRDIEKKSRDDEVFKDIRSHLLTGNCHKLKYKEYLTVKDELCAAGVLLLCGTRIVITTKLRTQIVALGHDGYPGIVVMKQRQRTKV